MMFDRLRSKEAATVSAVLALGLGVTACGGGSSSSAEGETQINQPLTVAASATPPESSLPDSGNSVIVQYYNDGTRQISFSNSTYPTIFEFCDGLDLVEVTRVTEPNNDDDPGAAGGGNVSRIVDHPGCADGRLTPSDFQLDPSK